LVTGCAGFIGSHLCERLLQDGHEVTGVDALTDSYDPKCKLKNLNAARESDRFHFVESEVIKMKPDLIDRAELIYHLAARPGVRTSWGREFERYLRNNVLTTQRLLEQAMLSAVRKRLVFTSSSSVYGDASEERVREDHPTNPVSPYGVTKLAGEQLCAVYAGQSDLEIVTLRLFTVYGPRQRPDMAFHRLIRAALTGSKFALYGDGRQRRDFTFVLDAVEAMVLASRPGVETNTFNIAGSEIVSMNEAVELVEEIAGRKIAVERTAPQSGDVKNTGAVLEKSQRLLGYSPRCALREGLQAQIEFMAGHSKSLAACS